MVEKAFNILDKFGQGYINVAEITNIFDVSKDKEFISGKKTKD
jgi:Ca2+-binding EF-hand superfamily protein